MLPYNTSSFSNVLDGPDCAAQRKAVVTPFKEDFDGSINNVMQHIADFTHHCHILLQMMSTWMTKSNVLHGYPIQDVIPMETY